MVSCCFLLPAWSVLNYILNNLRKRHNPTGQKKKKKSDFLHRLLAMMLLSKAWCVWNLSASQGCKVQSTCGLMSWMQRSWAKKVSVAVLRAFPMSSFLYPLFPQDLDPPREKEPCPGSNSWWQLSTPSGDFSPASPAGASTSLQHSVWCLPWFSPYQHLGFPSACFRKLSAQGGRCPRLL